MFFLVVLVWIIAARTKNICDVIPKLIDVATHQAEMLKKRYI